MQSKTQMRATLGLSDSQRPVVCVQGLGYVGAAMAVAVAVAADEHGALFDVVGVEKGDSRGSERAQALHAGRLPFVSSDPELESAVVTAHNQGNLVATTDPQAYALADYIIVDVHLDVIDSASGLEAGMVPFKAAIETIAQYAGPGTLVIVETTVPPGTCQHVVAPILRDGCQRRGLAENAVLLAHSYERIMPGPGYLYSVTNFWRVYAGDSPAAADACEAFLSQIINVADYPLRRLQSMTASETAKVLENSYRATNIAFMEEWGRLAEAMNVDLFEVIEAIRDRPTHNNIRQPGFGVGGYCLTKDPLFPVISAQTFCADAQLEFPFAQLTTSINRRMPITNLDRIQALQGGSLKGTHMVLLGVAYRSEVDDTRYAAAEVFVREATQRGVNVTCHDPHVRYWSEMDMHIQPQLPQLKSVDVIVLAVPHKFYRGAQLESWIRGIMPGVDGLIFDCDNVLTGAMRTQFRQLGWRVESTGRGEQL